jgi:hypothetical protein
VKACPSSSVCSPCATAIFACGDYCDKEVTKWSGWEKNVMNLMPFVSRLSANGGGDAPKAAKTAIRDMATNITKNTKIIFYTDAPPHFIDKRMAKMNSFDSNLVKEKKALGDGFDWLTLCTRLATEDGECRFNIPKEIDNISKYVYSYMSLVTGGKTLAIPSTSVENISKATIGILLSIMGHPYDFLRVCKFKFTPGRDGHRPPHLENDLMKHNVTVLDNVLIESAYQVKNTSQQLLKKFRTNSEFKDRVYYVFENILTPSRIKALTYNSLFGSLWQC